MFRIRYYKASYEFNKMSKFLFTENEVGRFFRKIPDGSTIAISGFNISTAPEYLILKLYETYEKTGRPKHLFIESDSLPGSPGRGIDKVCQKIYESGNFEFLDGVLMPFLGWSQWLQKLIMEEKIEGYTLSIGTMAHLFREVSAGRPGLLTKVGVGTFLDSRQDGGALNNLAKERRRLKVENIDLHGKDLLFISAPKPDATFIRGTTADEMGNISMEKEGIYGTVFTMVQAAKASPNRGIVYCQVERIARQGTINPKAVHVPGPLVDFVVVSPSEFAWQTGSIEFDPRISGGLIPPRDHRHRRKRPVDVKLVIQRRAAMEIMKRVRDESRPIIANFGVGIPSEIPSVLENERVSDYVYSTVEAGPWGGIPLTGNDFGVSVGPFAIIPLPDQFSLYEGGMIDIAILGFMQIDRNGDVNPSMLPGRIPGPGGFPAITCGSPSLVFAGQFMAGASSVVVEDGKLNIKKEGDTMKFVEKVYKILFKADVAKNGNKSVSYITERAVFNLNRHGVVLSEIAPGVDMDDDVIAHMGFKPIIAEDFREMEPAIFMPGKIGLSATVSGIHKGIIE